MHPNIEWYSLDTDRWFGIECYAACGDHALCIVHGFRSWHRWGFIPLVARWFAERGIATYVLALPSSGYGPDGFAPTRFEHATITDDRAALGRAIELIGDQHTHLAGLGHSRGCLLLVLEHAAFERFVLWSPPAGFGRWSPRLRSQWRRDGTLPMGTHPELGTPLQLGITYLDDLEQHHYNDELDCALQSCRAPTCIIVGAQDVVTPPSEVERIVRRLPPLSTQYHIIPATGHTFGVVHPATQITPALAEALVRTSSFVDAWRTTS